MEARRARREVLVSVGLVTWNSAPHLAACLSALARQTHAPLELVVVDNASTDDSLAVVQTRFPSARLIRNSTNEGFSRAHNQAIRLSRGEYYLALNPDVVLLPEYIATLVDALEARPACGSAMGKLWQTPDGDEAARIDSTGLFILKNRRQMARGHGEVDRGQYDRDGEIFGVDGAAPLYRRAMLDDVQQDGQFFDETFFAYKEDVDLAWRSRLLGWQAWYSPRARAFHERSFRPGQRGPMSVSSRLYSVRNRYLLVLKNELPGMWRRHWLSILTYEVRILGYLLLREPASLRAYRDVRRLWPQVRRKRDDLMSRARVDAAQALQWFR